MKIRTHRRPRRAQGMTEYIAIVGLIAIGLISAVSVSVDGSFGDAVDEAIQGTTNKTSNITTAMNSPGSSSGTGAPALTPVGTTDRGISVFDNGGTRVLSDGTTPYDASIHGNL